MSDADYCETERRKLIAASWLKMKPKLYLETTIPSYVVSLPSRDLIVAGHQQITRFWWNHQKDKFDIFISQFVLDEVSVGDKIQSQLRLEAISSFSQLEITDEVAHLASEMILQGIIPKKAAIDAAHIAVAAVHRIDYLMTWNCAHLANATIFNAINRICTKQGFFMPIICTPEELLGD